MVPLYEAATPTTSANHKDPQAWRLLLLIQAQLSSGAPTAPVKRAYNRAIRRASQSHLQGTIYTEGVGVSLQPRVT